VPRRLLFLLDLVLVLVAGALAFQLYQTWTAPLPLPSGKAPAASAPSEAAREAPAPRPPLDAYAVVASRNLFNPARSEVQPAPPAQAKATPATPVAPPRPYLHGVVVHREGSLAYLEDPRTRKVYAYRVGDIVGEGKVVEILEDRVVITRAGERIEVLLRDPSKPKVPAAATPAAARRAPRPPAPSPATPRILPRPPQPPTAEEEEAEPTPEGPGPGAEAPQ